MRCADGIDMGVHSLRCLLGEGHLGLHQFTIDPRSVWP